MAGTIQAAIKASKTVAKEIAKVASDYVAKNPGANRAEVIDAILNLSKESPDLSTTELITKFEQSVTSPTGAKGQVAQTSAAPLPPTAPEGALPFTSPAQVIKRDPRIEQQTIGSSTPTSLENLVETPDTVASGAGGYFGAVDITAPVDAKAAQNTSQGGSLKNKVAAGTTALGAAGAAGAALMDGEPQTLSPSSFLPVVDEKGNLTMGPEEKKYYEKVGGWQAERKRQAEYDSLKEGIDDEINSKFSAVRMTPPPAGSPTYKAEAAKIIQARLKPAPVAPKPADIPADELPGEGPSDQAPSEEPGQAVSPALGSEGGAPAETTQQNMQTLTEGTPKAQGGQESLTNSAQDIINKRTEFRSAIGGRTSVDRTELIDAIKSLDTVEEELKKEAAADPSKIPQLKDIAQARRDALDAYKEKANMNEWLSIADRAINAIGQFAAGRAALGTPYTSTYRPGVTDYGAKTEQAMREMQAETGILEKERGESEQAVSAYERKQEKLADRIRRQRESKVRLLEEDVRRQEREIDKADRFSADLMDNWLQTQRIEAQIKRETEKETKAEAQTQAQQDKAQQSFLQKEIDGLTKILQATNRIETGGVKPQNLSMLATALNTDPESLTEGTVRVGEAGVPVREKKKGFIFDESQSAYLENAVVPAISSQTKDLLDKAKKQLKEIEARRTGQQPAAAPVAAPTPTAAPTRQQPPATGTIKVRVGNQVGEIPANQLEAFKAKYPDSEVVK